MQPLHGGAEPGPLSLRQFDLIARRPFHKRVQNETELLQHRPQLSGPGDQGRDDLGEALLAEELRQGNGDRVEDIPLELAKVGRPVLCDEAVDRCAQISPERKEGDLEDGQSIL